jgi:hypothetical protein
MLLILYLTYLLLAKAILLAIMKIVYFSEFLLFIALKISLIKAILLYLSIKYFIPFK